MASGDPLQILHLAGAGTAFSYTSAIDFVITHWGLESTGTTHLNSWVHDVTGIYRFLSDPSSGVYNNGQDRPVVLTGNSITRDNADINAYGVVISGFEL